MLLFIAFTTSKNDMGKGEILKGLRAIALRYGISTSTARKLMDEVPCFKIGNTYFCYTDEVEQFLKNKKNGKQ